MLLDPGFDLTLRPMKYPDFYEMYKNSIKNTWTVEEVDFSTDVMDLRSKMTGPERHMINRLVAFFATGYYSGFGAVTAEIFPTAIRGTAQGFTYNTGRVVSAAAPFTVGTLAQTHGFSAALSISSLAFLAAAVFWIWIPETRGRQLT